MGMRLSVSAALFAALAFNLVFFVQELALVIPKSLLPGVHATLFHNNHQWVGDAPNIALLQGTGMLADLVVGLIFALLLARTRQGMGAKLFLFWMTFQGLYQGLSQILIGTVLPGNDVGMAMGWLGFGPNARGITGIAAVIAMVGAGAWLANRAIARLGTMAETGSGAGRMGFVFRAVTVPALAAVVLLVPFREPRNIVEVVMVPAIVMVSGVIWIQLCAGFAPVSHRPTRPAAPLLTPFLALLLVLALFQLVLRPGIAFSE